MTRQFSHISLISSGAALLLGTVTSGCRCSKEPGPAKEPLASAPSAVPSSSAAMSAPTPVTSSSAAKPIAIEAATGTLPASVVLSDPPEQVIGSVAQPHYGLHRLRGVVLVTDRSELYRLDGHKLVPLEFPSPHNARGAIVWQQLYAFYGSWPNQVWAEVQGEWVSDGARIYDVFSDTWVGKNGEWGLASGELATYTPSTAAAWSQGRVLGLHAGQIKVLDGPKSVVPKLAVGSGTACPTRVSPESIAALPSGELYAIGQGGCDDNAFLVERWTEASAESQSVDRLPAGFAEAYPGKSRVWLEAAAPNAVYALRAGDSPAASRLARFDGTRWQDLPLPAEALIRGTDVGEDGSLWIVLDRPYVFDAERRWRSVTIPKPAIVEEKPDAKLDVNYVSIAAFDANRAYFGMHYTYADTLYQAAAIVSTDSAPLERDIPADAGTDASAADAGATDAGGDAGTLEAGEPTPFGPSCTTPFVVLFSVSPSAPADFAYPATRDALLAAPVRPDVKFVEFSFRGKRTLGASATGAEQASSLVKLISERVKGSKPTLMCFAPSAIIREVKLP